MTLPSLAPSRHGTGAARRRARRTVATVLLPAAVLLTLAAPALSYAAGTARTDALYTVPPRAGTPATTGVARDLSAWPGYPAARPQAPEHASFSAPAAPLAQAYPPAAPTPPLGSCGVIANCSFESGGAGWIGSDLTSPYFALGVYPSGTSAAMFSTAATDGGFTVVTGWDGNGPGDITLAQDVVLPPAATHLDFDYRAAWINAGTLARTFSVEVQPSGGGAPLQTTLVLTAAAGTSNTDTGNITTGVGIAAFAGMPVRLLFRWHVPEYFTGPAQFQLDHVRVRENLCQVVSNCSFEMGTLASWGTTDLTTPLIPVNVYPAGVYLWSSITTPTDGGFVFAHGWDGNGPGDIQLFQDVVLPATTSSIEFDYNAYWNNAGTLPRTFHFEVEPPGGGAPISSQLILTAPAGTSLTTGPRNAFVDLRAHAGQNVRLKFRWHVPENYSGPADFQLDHIRLTQGTCSTIDNCSFESGAFPAWTATDAVSPFIPMQVVGTGASPGFGLFTSAPTDGSLALVNGFDANGPDVISVHQDITIPLWADQLRFDYRAGWDMLSFGGSTRRRTFEVAIEPSGGGPALASDIALVANPATQNFDTGPRSRTIPVSAFAGSPVRVVFRWRIPEPFTGPGFFQLDRVMFDNSVLAVGPGGSPGQALELRPAMPNPSRDAATFAFTLSQAGDVEMEIVDVRGARVYSERHAGLPAGEHRLAWSGLRSDGGAAPAGVYYARVRTPAGSTSRMFVRVR